MKAVRRVNRRPNEASAASRGSSKSMPVPQITPATTVDICDIPVYFPFKPYAVQLEYMKTVVNSLNKSENALLESPTGTGKTLCLLCATIAWQREQANTISQPVEDMSQHSNATLKQRSSQDAQTSQTASRSTNRIPTIIYASRTHSQLSQVVRELRNTRYRPKHAVLGSREQMCVNPKVKKNDGSSTATEINHGCNKLGKERGCSFRRKLEGFQAPSNESGMSGAQPVMDMEDLILMGKTHKVCPFYYTRSKLEDAELILVPYNYLFDRDARKTTLSDVPWENSIIIFDEAHNLESFASELASFDLTSTDIAGCIREIERGLGYIQANPDLESRVKPENVLRLKALFMNLEGYILGLTNDKSAFPGDYMMEIFRKGASINHGNYFLFVQEVDKLIDIFLDVQGGSGSKGAPRLEHFLQCLKRVFGEPSEARCIAKSKSYRVHVSAKSNMEQNGSIQKGRTISYWCFAPSEAMRELADLKVRSILVTSGTLSPLESYALELDIPFPHRLENPHIIPSDQIHVQIVEKGVSGKLLTSTYARRQDDEYYAELGSTLAALSRVIPGGMLVFFPSYSMMEMCIEKWVGPASKMNSSAQYSSNFFAARQSKNKKNDARYSFPRVVLPVSGSKLPSSTWKRLLDRKSIVLEPKTTSDLSDAISEFQKYLAQPKSTGCFLFGVCRGKISEGIDFANDMCRAVVITGLPFAPYKDPKVEMKREFLDTNRKLNQIKASDAGGFDEKTGRSFLTGQEWYAQGAHRAINQAIGRVIRNIQDYGAVLLLDSRFAQPSQSNGLSKWVRPHIRKDQGMGSTIGGLVKFFKAAATKAANRRRTSPPVPAPNNKVKMILQYENEETNGPIEVREDEEPTKIAVIQKEASSKGRSEDSDAGDSSSNFYVKPSSILERVDLRDQEYPPRQASGLKSITKNLFSNIPGGKLEDLYSRKRPSIEQFDQYERDRKHQKLNPSATKSTHSNTGTNTKQNVVVDNKEVIKKFFDMVRTRMNADEHSIVKKSLVAMHRYTDKDRAKYLRSAADLVQTLCRHESLEGKNENGESMLDLLSQVLPSNHRLDVQKMAIHQFISSSEFGKLCKQTFDSESCKRCFVEANSTLINLWYGAESDRLTTKQVLERMRKLYDRFVKSCESQAITGLQHFSKLLPSKYSRACDALVNETKATQHMRRMKESDKAQMGEAGIDLNRFRKNPLVYLLENDESQSEPNGTAVVDDDPGKESGIPPSILQAQTSSLSLAKRKAQDSGTSRSSKEKSGDDSIQIRKMLDDAELETFVGKHVPPKRKHIDSNAPKDLICSICNRTYDKPYIAECGHMSCLQCWFGWLTKSKSCPVCRAETTASALAQVIWKK